ncbi:MAG: DUF58 domain-containing protein, partial [Parvularculaceae bacterium]
APALAILLAHAGVRVGVLGGVGRLFQGRSAPARFLEALEIDRFDARASAPPALHVTSGSRMVFLSDFFIDMDTIKAALEKYAGAGAVGVLAQLVDPAEEDFPFQGRTEFLDTEGPDRRLFGDASSVAAGYRARFQAHRSALSDAARRLGWTFVSHRTDRPPQTALLALYAALGEHRMQQ